MLCSAAAKITIKQTPSSLVRELYYSRNKYARYFSLVRFLMFINLINKLTDSRDGLHIPVRCFCLPLFTDKHALTYKLCKNDNVFAS